MKLLTINCGSSSIKSAVVDTQLQRRLFEIRIDDLGTPQARLIGTHLDVPLPSDLSLDSAVVRVLAEVRARIDRKEELTAVVHRVVHGGDRFTRATIIDDATLGELERHASLAPLHNPIAIATIRATRALLPELHHVAVFDTTFHRTLPRRAREYALPSNVREPFRIQRFGFHGLSHAHVASAAATHLRLPANTLRIVSCHLGNGASVAAIEYGRSVDTSMGMTPLEGLVMGTRAGDLDPGILLHLMRHAGMNESSLDKLLNHESGLVGLTGTNDMRQVEEKAAAGNEEARLALQIYTHRIRKYIGAYAAVMGGVDVIAFTGGIGENSALIRHRCAQRLDFLGATLDEIKNRQAHVDIQDSCVEISGDPSRVKLLVVRANEELQMANEAHDALSSPQPRGREVTIPVAVSARHAHLSRHTLDTLFGDGYELNPRNALSQTGQFAARETVTLIGPSGRIENVRLMGPPREFDQVEISRTDEFVLGIDAPVRLSGDLRNSPGITIEGPLGTATVTNGVICAKRHIHMSDHDAVTLGVADNDSVVVEMKGLDRATTFADVTVRVAPSFKLELHLDTDEANAAGVKPGDVARLVLR